ncbi:unnamed protein product [Parnassius mnemosyne]|uniref:Reverse transcriptase domain-containing protein n=1 Tax=Parnassius mnemosyne TaxID=213953 RepID=A0AAV1KDL5_9NEOP
MIIEATLKKISFALVQEPYIGRIGEMKSYPGTRIIQCNREPNTEKVIKAAIVLFDDTINITQCPGLTTENIAVARLRTGTWEMGVVSVYLESDKPIDPYLDTIEKAVEALGTGSVIVGGDVNAWYTWWGSREADVRGIDVAAKLDELELHILNEGTEPTFDTIRGGKRFSNCVDITTCSTSLLGRVENWRLSEEITSSDHRAILFDINLEKSVGIDIERKTRKYNTKKANWSEFREKLLQIWSNKQITKIEIDKIEMREELEIKIAEVTKTITELCDNTLPKLKHKKRMGLPWWTDELTQRKKEVSRLKRRISYAAPIRREWVVEQYLNAKEGYQQEVKRAQTSSWKDFCSKQDRESMWDGIYRVIGRTTKRQEDTPLVLNGKTMGNEESAKTLAEIFYPDDDTQEDDAGHRLIRETARVVNEESHDDSCDPPFTMEELMWSVSSFNPKKAPGNDGLTADICEAAIAADPKLFLAIANKCLSLAYFPKKWKEAVVVVLRKPGKESYTHPKSYRPIGLLPVLGKIYEKMLIQRIKWHIVPKISRTQYGFMPQRSTEDSLYDMVQHIKAKLKNKKLIVLISLDIEGAFDNAWWPAIRCRLAESGCPINLRRLTDNYFEDRAVRVRYAGAEWVKTTAKGCVQGSIGGPIFWNLLLDPLLKELSEKGEHCQAFADDVVLIFSGDRALEVQDRANAALVYVQRWGVRNKLRFAPHKTKAMVITNKIKYDSPLLKMGGESIALSREIKILGLTIDDKLTFNTHIKNVCCKVQRLYSQLIRAAKINWGLNPGIIRIIYVAVTEPIIMYAASVWAPSTYKLKVKKQLDMAQRGFVQKIIKSYKTVSLHSALLLAGLLPLDLRPNKIPSTVQPLEQVTQQEQEVSAPEPTDMVEQQKGYQISEPSEKPEIDSASSFFSPPKLDEATTSSPVLTRTGSNLLRIRTQIKQAKAAEAQEILRAMSEAEETGDSDVDSGDTNISLDASTRSIGGSRMLLNELPRHANEILQRAKADLEKSSNLKREIRESVVAGLYTLYEMILKLSDSRMLHMLESSKQKANVSRESERLTQRHARFMHETLGQYALLKDSIEKLQKETESTRLIVSYDLCEAMTATRREITNIRSDTNLDSNLANQLRIITEEIKQLRGDMMSSHKPVTLEERQFPIAEELGELRRITQELSTKTKQSMPSNRGEETIRIEQLAKTTTELQQHITDTKAHLTADVQELKKEVHTISQDIKSLAAICSSSSFPSVQASLEELRKDTKELRDTALDSTAPIRVAIESLRTELKQRTDIEGTEPRGFSHLPGENYTERYQHTLMLQQKKFPRSFSEVVAKPNYPLIVESIDPRRTSDDVIKQIKGGVDVVDLGIGINQIRKAKNQKVLISCESEGDRNTLQDQLKSTANQLTVHRPATKFPLIRLTGVVFDLTDGKIVEAVMKQNATLLNDIPASQNHIKVIRRTKGRTSCTCNVILEVSPQIWTRLQNQKVRIGFQIVPATDQSPVIQCYRCLGYSHLARECQVQKIACGYCAESHDTRECCNKNKVPNCINCIDRKETDANCAHPAYSPECPEWRKWDRIARATISYC